MPRRGACRVEVELEGDAVVPQEGISAFDGNADGEAVDDGKDDGRSVKERAAKALTHLKQHKWKYMALKVSVIVIAVCCGLLLAYTMLKKVNANALVSGKIGTTVPAVSGVPAKPIVSSSSKRRLQQLREGHDLSAIGSSLGSIRRALASAAAIDPSKFDPSSDYATFGESSLTVGDISLNSVNTINMIACLTKQMRAIDVGLNTTYNPGLKPYTAIIDSGLCGESGVMTWAIKSSGPSGFGDGTYKSAATFTGFQTLMHIEFTNIVADGALKKSSVAWSSAGGLGKGITVIDYSNPSVYDVLLASSVGSYLHAIFNPTTYVGSVVSSNTPDTKFSLDFNNAAINRRTTTGSSVATVCLDFSAEKMLISGDQYTLFNAGDGSKKRQVMGYPITATVAGVTASLYAGYWGLDAPAVMSDDGTTIRYTSDQVKAAITDGLAVSVQQGDGSIASRTLKRVNGQLEATSVQTTTLGAIKGFPLTISDGSGVQIAWTGSKFVKVGKASFRCYYSDGNNFFSPVSTTASLNSESEAQQHCMCLDGSYSATTTTYSVKAMGSCKANYNDPGFDYDRITQILPGTEEYVPQSSYDSTIGVYNQQFSGRINLNVDALQQLAGVLSQHYTAGTVIKQESTGAIGTIYEDTPVGIVGLKGTSVSFTASLANNVLTVTSVSAGKVLRNWGFTLNNIYYAIGNQLTSDETNNAPNGKGTYSLSGSGSVTFASQTITGSYITTYYRSGDWQNTQTYCDFPTALSGGNYLEEGTTLTQGSITGTVKSGWGGYGPLEVAMATAGTKFNLTVPITVSAASMYGRWDITGTLSPDTTAAGVDDSWSNGNPVSVRSSGTGCSIGYDSNLALVNSTSSNIGALITTISGGTLTGATVNLYNYGGQIWGYVSTTGTSCQQTDLDGIKITFSCGAKIAVKCKTRFDSSSSTIRVKLSGSTKFASGQNKPIIKVSDSTEITDAWYKGLWYVQDATGKISPSTDSTTVSYSFYSITQPGDSIPSELWCYDNCPVGDSASSVTTIASQSRVKSVSEVSINNMGNCNQAARNGASITFSGYKTSSDPTYTLDWTENTDSSGTYYTLTSVTITDPGALNLSSSSSSPSWTFSTTGTACTTPPTFNSINANYGDYKDFRSVYKYSYDSLTGVLTDKSNNKPVLVTGSSARDQYFGPFFEGTTENKAALLCPWDSNLVCSWQVWQKLTKMYNWRTGPNSIRVSLLDANNKPLPFDAPAALLYQVPQGTKSNSGTKYDGVNLFMTYYNFGQLQGIPKLCVDSFNEPANCVEDSRFPDATSNLNDIILSSSGTLKDFAGNLYYAMPQVRTEYFPKASDAALCSSLTFASLPSIPDFAKLYVPPSNQNDPYPTADTLKSYFNGGLPAVIKGVALYEMQK